MDNFGPQMDGHTHGHMEHGTLFLVSLSRLSGVLQPVIVGEWAGGHFVFVASCLGPLRVNPLFTFNYTANYDGVNGWYYQLV